MLNSEAYKKYDPSDMRGVIRAFFDQVQDAVSIGEKVKLPVMTKSIKNIVLSGMGGSAIGGDLLKTYLLPYLKVPFIINRHYNLPDFVDESSLVIISSYSGNTEETLEAYNQAISKRARRVCITSGGMVLQRSREHKDPVITIPGGYQPRAALGYSFFPLLLGLGKMGFINIDEHEISETITVLKTISGESIDITDNNFPLGLAKKIHNKIPVVWSSSDLLEPVNLRWRTQIHENAKQLSYGSAFPELNHNEIVGWQHPNEFFKNFVIVILRDRDDHARVAQRMAITKEILKNIPHEFMEVFPRGESRLARMFSLVYMGDWVSFYLAMHNRVDPVPVERIDMLKTELSRVSTFVAA